MPPEESQHQLRGNLGKVGTMAGVNSSGGTTWASLLGANLPTRNDKNVMEIILEKDVKGNFSASDQEVAKLLQKLGADLRPGVHIEGVQICPMGRNVIQVTLNKNVEIEKFCNKQLLEIKPGLRVAQIRPSGRREVVLLIKGLHPNTLDETVIRYLRCMGKVEKAKVILDTYREGPLVGIQNGDRRYTVEFRPDILVGTVHIIDGQKVNLSYPGQKRSCFWCLKGNYECPGKGVARDCKAAGGERKLLTEYMVEFWKKINYSPDRKSDSDDLDDLAEEAEVIQHQVGGQFTPKSKPFKEVSGENYGAVSVKWFPKKADHGEVKEFLTKYGLPAGHDQVNIKDSGQVIIENLDTDTCTRLCESITGNKFRDKKTIYCHGIVLATPEKENNDPKNKEVVKTQTTQIVSQAVTKTFSTSSPADQPIKKTEDQNDPLSEFAFSPVDDQIKSKLLYGTSSDSEAEPEDSHLDESDIWLTKNERKRKNKKKENSSRCNPASFKKIYRKTTPKSKK